VFVSSLRLYPSFDVEVTVQRLANVLVLKVWFEDVPGYSVVKMRPVGAGRWWFDLVRVGSTLHRGHGYGSRLLEEGIRYAYEELGATNVGLEPRALGWKTPFVLADWYRRHGFVHEHEGELWMEPP
jgi:GNAT superfamily N-acetyltransferase